MSASSVLSIIAPQFNDVSNRNDFLSLAILQISSDWFADKYDLAVAYLTAHMMSLDTSLLRQNGETGAISSKKEGELSITFSSSNSKGDGNFNQTHYGKQYAQLRDSCGFIVGITGGVIR